MDIPAMRANFAKAAATGDEAPLYFYSHLFLSHPETREMFPVSMAHQRDRLFAALGDVVARVDDLDALVPILQQLGRDHRKFGTVAAHYPAVGGSLLATLEHFDDEWTPELAKDWTEAYTLVAEVMVAAADEAAEQPAWWDADVVGHERRTIDVAVLQVRPRAPLRLRGRAVGLAGDRAAAAAVALLLPRQRAAARRPARAARQGPGRRPGELGAGPADRRRRRAAARAAGRPPGAATSDSDRDLLLVAGGMGLAPLKALVDQVARHGPAAAGGPVRRLPHRGPGLRPRRPAATRAGATPG